MANDPFREIRAIHDDATIRVYQAYNDSIADLAVAANSFQAAADAGVWSATRMTWIKPSAVWMAYRCGWSTMKDKNQARVLALDLSRAKFEELLMAARLSHGGAAEECKDGTVVVQWDPEREMDPTAERKQVFTRALPSVRSIQIGLRSSAVASLFLDRSFLLRVTDVTPHFRAAAAALSAGDVQAANVALWPDGFAERAVDVPLALRAVLQMDVPRPSLPDAKAAQQPPEGATRRVSGGPGGRAPTAGAEAEGEEGEEQQRERAGAQETAPVGQRGGPLYNYDGHMMDVNDAIAGGAWGPGIDYA